MDYTLEQLIHLQETDVLGGESLSNEEKIALMKKLREEERLNRKEFGEKYGIPYPTLTDWELGNRRIPEYLLKLLAYRVRVGRAISEAGEHRSAGENRTAGEHRTAGGGACREGL